MDYYPYLISGTDTYTRQNVGLLSRIPPTNHTILGSASLKRTDLRKNHPLQYSKCQFKSNKNQSTSVSKNYYTYMEVPLVDTTILPLLLFGIHLKAKPTHPKSCSQREAQALIIRDHLRSLVAQYNSSNPSVPLSVVLLGDFNDFDDSISDFSNNKPSSSVFDILRDFGVLDMVNVMGAVPKNKLYSHWWDRNQNNVVDFGELSLLDHIMVSRNLIPFIDQVIIHHDDSGINRISDHWPISVTFNFDGANFEQSIFGKDSIASTSLDNVVLVTLCVVAVGFLIGIKLVYK
ncbi:exodeoxyribonuclease III [Acrasis kona]|uniref:Exodeoxyribonuclease III n=1 Tax=Acrasis kona TaxID=1008807 RepID=A0AAW2ZB18_9EUKA